MMYKIFIIILFSYLSRYLRISHTQPQSEHKSIRSMLSRNPGWSVTTSKRMRWRRLAAPPLFKLQSSVTTSKRMRWRRLAAPPLLKP
jgi:hypothetical protein